MKTVLILSRGPAAIEMDAAQYWRLATLVVSGDVFMLGEPIAYRTPAYPWFLALMRSFAGINSLALIVAIQGLLYVASAWIAAMIAQHVTGSPSSKVWALLVYLPATSALTFYGTTLSEPLFVFLMMSNLLAVMQYAKAKRGRQSGNRPAAWIGLTLGVLLLTRPIALLLWIPHVVFIALIQWERRQRFRITYAADFQVRHRAIHFAVALGTVLLILSPWLMRNHHLFGKPFLTEFTGRNLWIVAFQDGSGSGFDLPKNEDGIELKRRIAQVATTQAAKTDSWRQTWFTSNALTASGLNDYQTDRLMKSVAVESIRRRPREFGENAFRRTLNFWRTPVTDLPPPSPQDNFGNQWRWSLELSPVETAINHRLSRSVTFNTAVMFAVGLSLIGLMIHQPTRGAGVWLGLVLAYFSVVTGILEIPAYRYRMVIEPVSAIVVGAMASLLWDKLIKYSASRQTTENE